MTTIDTIIAELQAYIDAMKQPLAGAIKQERLDLTPEARAVAVEGHEVYASETTRATNAIDALRMLASGSFPEVPFFMTTAEIDAYFDANEDDINAFNTQVRAETPLAAQLEMHPGEEIDKK